MPNVDSRVFGGVMLAPVARRAAVSVGALPGGGEVWVAELETGTFNPLTREPTVVFNWLALTRRRTGVQR